MRLLSYSYNLYWVTATQVGIVNGVGACKTIFPNDWQIYQEHIISVVFELGLALQFANFIYRTRVPNVPLQDFFAKVVDNETCSFVIYLIVEILYLIVFQFNIVKQWVLNSFYFLIPSVLYLSNIVILTGKKGLSTKKASGSKVLSVVRKAEMKDELNKTLPKSDTVKPESSRDLATIRKNSVKDESYLRTIRKPSVDNSAPIRKE
ncbi:hypothetical protein HDV01_003274 [Terramyces sp. JEL0728]|nr:hypothetical protein HDV01_003274 [Terramyces sp. JEL0728]